MDISTVELKEENSSLREEILSKMTRIKSKKDLNEWLDYERKKYKIGNSLASFISAILFLSEKHILWRIQRRLRICEYHLNCRHKLRYKINIAIYHSNAFRAGINIPPNTCGKGLKIVHLGNVLINQNARIGEDAVFHVNTAIVAGSEGKKAVVGNNLLMFVGSTIVKGVTVSDNVRVAAGAVVTKDVEENNVSVAGVPAKIIKK